MVVRILSVVILLLISSLAMAQNQYFYFVAIHCSSKQNADTSSYCKHSFYTSIFTTPRAGMELQIRKQVARSFEYKQKKIIKECNCFYILPDVQGPFSTRNHAKYEMERSLYMYQHITQLHQLEFFFYPDQPVLDDDQNYFLFK